VAFIFREGKNGFSADLRVEMRAEKKGYSDY
jgi:hypothetical protein